MSESIVRRDDVTVREVDGDLIVLDAGAGFVHRLNATASHIWRQCDGEASVEAVAARLVEAFDVPYDLAMSDVVRTISELRQRNLVVSSCTNATATGAET